MPTEAKPGVAIQFSVTKSDFDHKQEILDGAAIDTYPADVSFKPDDWEISSVVGSTINGSGNYTPGTPSAASTGNDQITITVDDTPTTIATGEDGSRDDSAWTRTITVKVRIPFQIVLQSSGTAPTGGVPWSQTLTWLVKDQFGTALGGVVLAENPVTICTDSPSHETASHLSAYTTSGEATSHSDGSFTDEFGVGAGLPAGKALTIHQHYTVTYGTYSAMIKEYRVKIINAHNSFTGLVIDQSAPETWSDSKINHITND